MGTTARTAIRLRPLVSAAVFLLHAVGVPAQEVVPVRVPYQGMVPGVTGAHNVEIQLYDAAEGGTLVWSKAYPGLVFSNERFSVILEGVSDADAGVTLLDALANPERYLEVVVDSVSLGIRQRLASAPYAIIARNFVPDESGMETFSFIPNAATIHLPDAIDKRGPSPALSPTVLAARITGFTVRSESLLEVGFQASTEVSAGGNTIPELHSTSATFVIESDALEAPVVVQQVVSAGPAMDTVDRSTYFTEHTDLHALWIGPVSDAPANLVVDVSVFLTYRGPQQGDQYFDRFLTVQEVFQPHEELRTIPPVADFDADLRSEPFPVVVRFSDLSKPGSAAIESWHWNFGDAKGTDPLTGEPRSESVEQHPVHRYTVPGTYTVTLTVRTVDGEHTVVKDGFIVVEELK